MGLIEGDTSFAVCRPAPIEITVKRQDGAFTSGTPEVAIWADQRMLESVQYL
jgi:hypothetical protein